MNKNLARYMDGDALKEILPKLKVGNYLYYRNILHRVIDAGKQGHRIAAVKGDEENIKWT